MKLLFSFLLSAIILVLMIASCTIEKRLYQPGYHVEWNKRARSVEENGTVAEKQVVDQQVQSEEKQVEIATEETKSTEETTTQASTISITQDQVPHATKNATVNNNTNIDQQTETIDESHEAKSVLKKQSRGEHYLSGLARGLIMILMGLLLILMGFLLQNIWGGFGVILLIIFGIGGAIMIVVGIVIMILG